VDLITGHGVEPSPIDATTAEIVALGRSLRPWDGSWAPLRYIMGQAAAHLRRSTGQLAVPVDLRPIQVLRNVLRIAFFRDRNGPEAILAPTREGFIIRLRDGLSATRQRFDIAHEIGHTLFYDIGQRPPRRLILGDGSDRMMRKEEDACHFFARTLLVPNESVGAITTSAVSLIEAINTLAEDCNVSVECAAIRVLRDSDAGANSVAIMKTSHSASKGRPPSRIWGHRRRKSMRLAEAKVLETVEKSLELGEYDRIRWVADTMQDVATIELPSRDLPARGGLEAIVRFRG
jgi:Zn-dependent peptidase ImmA (M78 family)